MPGPKSSMIDVQALFPEAQGDGMTKQNPVIIWTWTDEAPALATLSLLPIVRAFTRGTGVSLEVWDISLAGRIIANFPEHLAETQRMPDYLAQLGELTHRPEANIIKLPNISASVPQLADAIKELQEKGYKVPDYPENPRNESERAIQACYAKVLGSAVNPVIRQGNSDRRAPASVKQFARKTPHQDGRMESGFEISRGAHDRRGFLWQRERLSLLQTPTEVRYEFVADDGRMEVLKKNMPVPEGAVLDTSVMNVRALRSFYEEQIAEAKRQGLLLSLHLKATMMKVSDPVLFGHAVSVYFSPVFEKHAETFEATWREPGQWRGRFICQNRKLAGGEEKRDRIGHPGGI